MIALTNTDCTLTEEAPQTVTHDAVVDVLRAVQRGLIEGTEPRAMLALFCQHCPDAVLRVDAMKALAVAIHSTGATLGVNPSFPAAYLNAWVQRRPRSMDEIIRAFGKAISKLGVLTDA